MSVIDEQPIRRMSRTRLQLTLEKDLAWNPRNAWHWTCHCSIIPEGGSWRDSAVRHTYETVRNPADDGSHCGLSENSVIPYSREMIGEPRSKNLDLIEGDDMKRAATLLFAENQEKDVSGAVIKIAFFITETRK